MNLNDAIKHAREKSCGTDQCSKDHAQLAGWLEELAAAKEELEEWRFTNKVDELCRRVDRAEAELAATRKLVAARQLMEMKLHGEVLQMRDNAEAYGPLGFEAVQAALQAVLVAMDEHEYGNTSALSAAIAEAVEPWRTALAAMCEEFRGHDLPYGSKAYKRSNDLLYGRIDAATDAALTAKGRETQETTWPPEDLDTQ